MITLNEDLLDYLIEFGTGNWRSYVMTCSYLYKRYWSIDECNKRANPLMSLALRHPEIKEQKNFIKYVPVSYFIENRLSPELNNNNLYKVLDWGSSSDERKEAFRLSLISLRLKPSWKYSTLNQEIIDNAIKEHSFYAWIEMLCNKTLTLDLLKANLDTFLPHMNNIISTIIEKIYYNFKLFELLIELNNEDINSYLIDNIYSLHLSFIERHLNEFIDRNINTFSTLSPLPFEESVHFDVTSANVNIDYDYVKTNWDGINKKELAKNPDLTIDMIKLGLQKYKDVYSRYCKIHWSTISDNIEYFDLGNLIRNKNLQC